MNEEHIGNTRPLYIPVKTLDSDDLLQGIGNMEIFLIAISAGIALMIGLLVAIITNNNIYGVGAAILLVSIAVCIFRRDITNENMIRKFQILYKHVKKSKKYIYVYYNELNAINITDDDYLDEDEFV